jgi:all-trans-retinol 13,14-reductase
MTGSPETHKLRSSNIWVWPNRDYDAMIDAFHADPHNAPIPLFAGFPCAKDGTWNERFPDRSNAVIMTLAKYDWCARVTRLDVTRLDVTRLAHD